MEANVILVDTTAFKAAVPMKIGRWVRFPHVSAKIMFKILLFVMFCSSVFTQGIFVNSNTKPVYSLNILYNSISNESSENNNYYGLGISNLLNGNNEFSLMYKKKSNAKSIETSYLFYIKPQFYINMNFGFGYEYFKYNSGIATNIYNLKVGVYGRGSKDTNKTIKFHPLFNYEYYIDENYDTEYDIFKAGMILVFNDIGIETTYSWISRDVNEISLKLYLWEFRN